ncbi:MAG: Alpha/beta hydrolase family protein [Candidatus Omnitrophica bacterium ADurb.Bin277]|nr:MAG: Alpha/beta hydrolase family protein [Candidatus Omnitrophica bacterium ADurb.Bin277]
MHKYLIWTLPVLFLVGCLTVPSSSERLETADRLARENGFTRTLIRTEPFLLTVYEKIREPGRPLRVYIEGDGYAFVTRSRVSWDPTPRDPLAFKLAALDPSPNIVYLARPCQYTSHEKDAACDFPFWTNARFSEEVICSMNAAVDSVVRKVQASGAELVGYSGGGAVAVLVAARRADVRSIRTVAGNLDPEGVNQYHGVSPLDGSLDPLEVAGAVKNIPQIHFTGGADEVVPFLAVNNWSKSSGPGACLRTVSVRGADHGRGWVEAWPELLGEPLPSC